MNLSLGALEAICQERKVDNPILKVEGIKVTSAGEKPKIRLNLTDGQSSYSLIMLPGKYLEQVNSGQLCEGSIIKVLHYCIKTQNDKTVILISDFQLMSENDDISKATENVYIEPKPQIFDKPEISKPSDVNTNILPINFVTSYMKQWAIKGRCINKGVLRTWSKPSSEGKLFSFELMDKSSDIKVTVFNKEVDKYYDLIEVNNVYTLSKGKVQPKKPQFNKTKSDFEIVLNEFSELFQVESDEKTPKIHYNFLNIDQINDKSLDANIDVVAIVHSLGEITTVMSKTKNTELKKRDVVLVDKSGYSINLTLWGEQTHILDGVGTHPSIIIKGALVREFQGYNLTTGFDSMLMINSTDISEALSLSGWYQEEGHARNFIPIGNSGGGSSNSGLSGKIACLTDITMQSGQRNDDKADFFNVFCNVIQIKTTNCVYKACNNENCNKKVEETGSGTYRCGKCDMTMEDYKYRLMLNVRVSDYTNSVWITCFQNLAEIILCQTAQQIGEMMECEEKQSIDQVQKSALFTPMKFVLRSKMETFNDESRLKIVGQNGDKLDWATDSERLIALLS